MSWGSAMVSGEDTSTSKPLLFLHIPKTAGTSFLLMLQNTFGDGRVRRIHTVDEHIKDTITKIVSHELGELSCLTGHLPFHLFGDFRDIFTPFTMLREPVSRVLSLYRFLKAGEPANWARLNLPEDFTLDDFLELVHPELYGQVNNGMIRLLCGDARWANPDRARFWDKSGWADALHGAITTLTHIDFGLAEEMEPTLDMARVHWSVPYKLQQYQENRTKRETSAEDVDDIHRIISMNTLDLALYHWAADEFHKRIRALPPPSVDQVWNSRSVFVPYTDRSISVADIPGRRGFHEFEGIGVAWLQADQVADVHFAAVSGVAKLRLHLFCIVKDYPTSHIMVSINGRQVEAEYSMVGDKWGWLETEHFETRQGLNRLTLQAPMFLPASALDPMSGDERRLGVALADLILTK